MALPLIVLIGPRGCGKTTVGKALADALGWGFTDLDDLTLQRLNQPTVSAAWAGVGEAGWRSAEREAAEAILDPSEQKVVALGGGTPMLEPVRRRIEDLQRVKAAWVVYLKCAVSELSERLRLAPGDRPSLTGADPLEEIQAVLTEREPVYIALADVIHRDRHADAERIAQVLHEEWLSVQHCDQGS